MENYILQILESSTRVIVPEFGAFIVKQRNPLTIVFNEFLQYNDGVLVDIISKNESISRDDAKRKIDDYVQEINEALTRGESFKIGKMGYMIKGGLGKISLEQQDDNKPVRKVAAKIESTSVKPAVKKKVIPKQEIKTDSATKKIATEKQDLTQVTESEGNEKGIELSPANEPIIEIEKESAEENIEKKVLAAEVNMPREEQKEPISTAGSNLGTAYNETETSSVFPKAKSRFKRNTIVTWVIIVLGINVLLLAYFIYSDELKGIFSPQKQDVLIIEPQTSESVDEDQTISEESAATKEEIIPAEDAIEDEPDQINEISASVADEKFYIVAGVFMEESNADKLVKELQKMGYNSEKFGKIGNLHAVSYEVFKSKPEADRYLLKIQKETDPEAWIRKVN